jgi:hypothetical protein
MYNEGLFGFNSLALCAGNTFNTPMIPRAERDMHWLGYMCVQVVPEYMYGVSLA